MCVGGVDQYAAPPINPFERSGDLHPIGHKNNDVALGCLLLRPRDGAWAEISDKTSQCFRTSGIGYDQSVTGCHQMTSKRASYRTGPYKSYFHNNQPLS